MPHRGLRPKGLRDQDFPSHLPPNVSGLHSEAFFYRITGAGGQDAGQGGAAHSSPRILWFSSRGFHLESFPRCLVGMRSLLFETPSLCFHSLLKPLSERHSNRLPGAGGEGARRGAAGGAAAGPDAAGSHNV